MTVPASEEAFDLSPLCWSKVRRLPEARRTSHTLTLLSALGGKWRHMILLYTLCKMRHSKANRKIIVCSPVSCVGDSFVELTEITA